MKQFTVPIKISATRVADMLVGAFEGGSNYWAGINRNKCIEPVVFDFDQFKGDREFCGYDELDKDGQHIIYTHVHFPMSPGGYLYVYDKEDRSNHCMLGLPEIEKGLVLMAEKAPSHFADLISNNDDASTADAFVQCCTLGDIVYG